MRYLVLGSAGQIGKPLTRYLSELGHDVTTFDIKDSREQDLRKANNMLLEKAVQATDFVFFLAWDVGGSKYLSKYQDSYDFIYNNLAIMTNVFDVLRKCSKPFVFVSSQMSDIHESSYGLTKRIGEKISKSLNGLVVKLWNVYDYEDEEEKSHVITDFICAASVGEDIKMLTDGNEYRQFLHASDCVKCFYTLSNCYAELDKSKEYHITSFEWTTIKDLAQIVADNFGVNVIPGPATDTIQFGHKVEPDTVILNYWKPTTTLDQGVKLVIKEMTK